MNAKKTKALTKKLNAAWNAVFQAFKLSTNQAEKDALESVLVGLEKSLSAMYILEAKHEQKVEVL